MRQLAMLCSVMIPGAVMLAALLGSTPGAVANAESDTSNQTPAVEPPTSQPADADTVELNVGIARNILGDLRKTCQAGTTRVGDLGDAGLRVLPLLLQDKIPGIIRERIADAATRDAALDQARKASRLLETTLTPAVREAQQSQNGDDARAIVPLLDQLDRQLVDLAKIVPPGSQELALHQSLVSARQSAATAQCVARMAGLMKAFAIYAHSHKGHFPATLGELYRDMVDHQGISLTAAAEAFLCPNDSRKVTIPAQVTPEWINQNSSYVYLGSASLTEATAGPRTVLLHEKLDAGHSKYINVSFANFHVISLPGSEAESRVAESKRLLAPRAASRPQ